MEESKSHDSEEPELDEQEVQDEEIERRQLLLEVIARSLDTFSKQRRKDIILHKDELLENEFDTVPWEDQTSVQTPAKTADGNLNVISEDPEPEGSEPK